jgi:hypothetical protein
MSAPNSTEGNIAAAAQPNSAPADDMAAPLVEDTAAPVLSDWDAFLLLNDDFALSQKGPNGKQLKKWSADRNLTTSHY